MDLAGWGMPCLPLRSWRVLIYVPKNHLFAEMLRKIREGLHWPLHASFFFLCRRQLLLQKSRIVGIPFSLAQGTQGSRVDIDDSICQQNLKAEKEGDRGEVLHVPVFLEWNEIQRLQHQARPTSRHRERKPLFMIDQTFY